MDMPSMHSHTHTCTSKSVAEYPLPAASMTHELAQISGQNLLVISQMDNSTLLKVAVDPASGKPQAVAAFPIGSMMGGLHGLVASKAYPGQIWCTFQFDNKLVRLDPGRRARNAPGHQAGDPHSRARTRAARHHRGGAERLDNVEGQRPRAPRQSHQPGGLHALLRIAQADLRGKAPLVW